jgi:fructose-bisphosphate aldolase, class I
MAQTGFGAVRTECERYGMPIIMWSYLRGRAVAEKGERNSIYEGGAR